MTIRDNVLAGLKLARIKCTDKDALVEQSLTRAGLWREVRDRLDQPGGALSGGQQQRLCIARSLAVAPNVLLMDEPCSALDPTSTRRIEETIAELRSEVTVVIVTHNMQQAHRVSDLCAFFLAEENEPGLRGRAGRRPRRCSTPPRTPGPSTTSTGGSGEDRATAGRSVGSVRAVLTCRPWSSCAWSGAPPASAGPQKPPPDQRPRIHLCRPGLAAVGRQGRALQGLHVNYTPRLARRAAAFRPELGRLRRHRSRFSELHGDTANPTTQVPRGFAYIPDVAGAMAIMYHVAGPAGSRSTTSTCRRSRSPGSSWATSPTGTSPKITTRRLTKGLVLPTSPSPSTSARDSRARPRCSTTSWSTPTRPVRHAGRPRTRFRPTYRIMELDAGPASPAPTTGPGGLRRSDQIAQAIASARAVVHRLRRVRLRQGYLQRGLGAERLGDVPALRPEYLGRPGVCRPGPRHGPDTRRRLRQHDPVTYPISAYSYLIYQCAPTPARPTCKAPYANPGVLDTMAKFMRYIACTGQLKMATIGYSPLPPNSARVRERHRPHDRAATAETFAGKLRQPAVPGREPGRRGDTTARPRSQPLLRRQAVAVPHRAAAAGQVAAAGARRRAPVVRGRRVGARPPRNRAPPARRRPAHPERRRATTTTPGAAAAVGSTKAGTQSVGGGSSTYQSSDPTVYRGPAPIGAAPPWPWLVAVLLLLIPVAWLTVSTSRRRARSLARTARPACRRRPIRRSPTLVVHQTSRGNRRMLLTFELWSVFYRLFTDLLGRICDSCHEILTPDTRRSPGSSSKKTAWQVPLTLGRRQSRVRGGRLG